MRKELYFVVLIFIICSGSFYAQTAEENYILTKQYKEPTTNPITNPTTEQANMNIVYFDGLGRPIQEIAKDRGGQGGDMITPILYDALGRQAIEYLPYIRFSSSLEFDPDAVIEVETFYSGNSNIANTTVPFSEKKFEPSLLNRVLLQAHPGEDWKMTSGAEIKFSYLTNDEGELHYFKANSNGSQPLLQYNGYYPPGELFVTMVKDENSGVSDKNGVVEYKNKLGRTVLKRTVIDPGGRPPDFFDTYYVYDEYGNLTFVLPPKLSEQIVSGRGLVGNYETLLDALGYRYVYDYRNRIKIKKLPGRQKEYIAYDRTDRIIATGPALSPFGDQAEGWLRSKYDFLGRVAYTLWEEGAVNENTHQNIIQNHGPHLIEKRTETLTTINGIKFGYTNQVKPTAGYEVLTVNYYDNYTWPEMPLPIPETVCSGESRVYYNIKQLPTGLPTGSWTRLLDPTHPDEGKINYLLYDYKARPVRTHVSYPSGGYTRVDSKLGFTGNVLKNLTYHRKDSGADEIKITEDFNYTDQLRLDTHTHQVNNLTPQLLSKNHYDPLGQLKQKRTGGIDISGAAPLQIVDYNYNIRGWLTDINNVNNLNQPGGGPVDLFAFKINYNTVIDDINGQVKELYNGNISETFWRTATDNVTRKYGYSYDDLNRITAAYYQVPGTVVPRADTYSTSYSYDSNGNLLTLQRNGNEAGVSSVIAIDDLIYSYDKGNQLQNVMDKEGYSDGYNDRHPDQQIPDFEYDDYGNLVLDRDKEIQEIRYNHLNLPTKISFTSNREISYIYDASGVKTNKEVNDGTQINTTLYTDGFQYSNNLLEFFPTAEGYVKTTLQSSGYDFNYVFNHTDHLGNIRVRYTQHPETGATEILQEDHYYPFGLKHEGYNNEHFVFSLESNDGITLVPATLTVGDSYKFKFQSQEFQDELGLNWYSFKWRNYDPAIARFFNIDPLAEEYSYQSPYNFSENRVIDAVELEGLEALVIHAAKDYHAVMNRAATAGERNSATFGVSMLHPIAASKVGQVVRGGTNISSVSGRVARHVAENGNMTVGDGSERNAFRHALWSATMANEFGDKIATRIGNAHEGVKALGSLTVDFSKPLVQNGEYADSVVDVLNNEIGRGIVGSLGENASQTDIAKEVLKVQLNEGLWTSSTDKDGNISISRTKITQKQYNNAMKTLGTLDNNGLNEKDRQELEKK